MVHAIIIDDEINGLKSLELLLADLKQEIKIVGTTTDAVEAIELINSYRPDVVFLDISMPQLNGFEVLERLQFKNFHLVFTTAHRNFALKAIKQGAVDYLLKPVDIKELYETVARIKEKMAEGQVKTDMYELLKRLNEVQNMRVLLPSKKSTEYVFPADIIYIEARSNNSQVGLTNGQLIEVISNLKDFEYQLCKKESSFMRVHHSYIINVDYVTRYIKDDGGIAVLKGKKSIPISRQRKEDFLKKINFQS